MILWTLLLIAFASSTAAQIYRWEDAQGNVQYSDQRPQGEVTSESVDVLLTKAPRVEEPKQTTLVVADRAESVENFTIYPDTTSFHDGLRRMNPMLTAVGDSAWAQITRDQIVEVDTLKNTARPHTFDYVWGRFEWPRMRRVEDRFVVLGNQQSKLHVYQPSSGRQQEFDLDTDRHYSEVDTYGLASGEFFLRNSGGELLHLKLQTQSEEWELRVERPVFSPSPNKVVTQIASGKGLMLYNYREPRARFQLECLLKLYDNNSRLLQTYKNAELGIPSNWGCTIIAAGAEEIWLEASIPREYARAPRKLVVLSLTDKSWRHFNENTDGQRFRYSQFLTLTEEHVFFSRCKVLRRIDRETGEASSLDLSSLSKEGDRECIYSIELHDGSIYFLTRHFDQDQFYPLLYKLPMSLFDTWFQVVGDNDASN